MRYLAWTVAGLASVATIGEITIQPAMAQTVLYNPTAQKLPAAQGWFGQVPTGATQKLTPNGETELNTTANLSLQSGYFRFSPWNLSSLNRTNGYTIQLDLQLLSESHISEHRAGFSLIAISSDLQGIEIGFWQDRIWAQNDAIDGQLFTQGERQPFNTSQALTRYQLVVQGGAYCLFANNQQILTGRLRNYSSFGFPYSTRGFLFAGDNTKSAQATSRIGRVELTARPVRSCS